MDSVVSDSSWRCCGPCHQLMYNYVRDKEKTTPVDKTCPSRYLSTNFPRLCNVCWEMYNVLTTNYWYSAQAVEQGKLRPGDGNPYIAT